MSKKWETRSHIYAGNVTAPRNSSHTLKEKRNQIIEMLRRSGEQEELALCYLKKAAAFLPERKS